MKSTRPLDPVSGPLPREKLRELAAAPHGDAIDAIRQYDPLWGLPEGTKIKWEVEVCAEVTGYASVQASSEEEARKAAEALRRNEIDFDLDDSDSFSVETIKPVGRPPRRLAPSK